MAMCKPGREVPGQHVVTNALVVDEEWGEMWRAEHDGFGKVLFIAYTTPLGVKMFQEALPALERWKASSHGADQRLLGIRMISADTAIPYLLVEDTGGPTLRELANDPTRAVAPDDYVKWFAGLFEGIVAAMNLNLVPIGVSPDTVFYDPNNAGARWRLAPVGPGGACRSGLIGRGRYVPRELAHMADVSLTHADTYGLSWILAEILAGRDDMPRLPSVLDETIGMERLATELKAGVQSQNGVCMEPMGMAMVLKRWLRNDAEKEMKAWRKAHKKATGKAGASVSRAAVPKVKAKRKSSDGGGTFAVGLLLSLLKIGLVLAVFGAAAFGTYKLFTTTDTNKTPLGTARLFCKEVVANNQAGALQYTTGNAVGQTEELFTLLRVIREGNLASPLAEAQAVTERTGAQSFIGQATLKGTSGESFLLLTFRLHEQEDGTYRIYELDWEGLNQNTLGL
jgi:hypothetical protein